MTTKKEFMSRPKIASLPLAQREARWKQHKRSPTGRKSFPQKGKGKALASSSRIASAVSYTKKQTTGRPRMSGNEKHVIIRNKEFFLDVQGYTAWTLGSKVINPGNGEMFPWLSQVARNYESYRFRKLVISFETTSPTSIPGSLMMTAEFNVSDLPPSSKIEMMAYADAVRTAPWSSCSYRPKLSDINRRKSYYVDDLPEEQTLPLAAGNAENLDDVGVFLFATSGVEPNAEVIGEFYVDYEIELMTPQFDTNSNGQYMVSVITTTGVDFSTFANATYSSHYLKPLSNVALVANRPGTYLVSLVIEASSGVTGNASSAMWDAGSTADVVSNHCSVDSTTDDVTGYAVVNFRTRFEALILDSAQITAWGLDAVATQCYLIVAPFDPNLF